MVAKYGIPGSQIEIVIPEGPNTPIDRFIEQNGQGLHHIALTARGDIANAWAALSNSGFQPSPIQPSADGRASLFLHPRGCGGILVEIVEEDR